MWLAILVEGSNQDTKWFEGKARVICDIINRELAIRKTKIPGVRKITISLTSTNNLYTISGPVKGYSPITNIRRTFDFDLFKAFPEERQNETILRLVEQSICDAAIKFDWKLPEFGDVVNHVRQLGFKQRYLEGKLKPSKDKRHKAGVEVEMFPEEATLSIVFFSADDKLLSKVNLITVRPDRLFIVPLLGKAFWVNNNEFELVDKRQEIHFRANISKNTAELFFTPVGRKTDKVIDDLLILSSSTKDALALSLLKQKVTDEEN